MKVFATIGVLILALIFLPVIGFWLSYFGGWLVSLVLGPTLCEALNTTFGTTRFTPEMLPWIAGALGWIGSYFKTVNTSYTK